MVHRVCNSTDIAKLITWQKKFREIKSQNSQICATFKENWG